MSPGGEGRGADCGIVGWGKRGVKEGAWKRWGEPRGEIEGRKGQRKGEEEVRERMGKGGLGGIEMEGKERSGSEDG